MLSVARGEDRRHSHRKVSSPCYATTLCAPGSSQQHGAVARTTVKSDARFARRLAAPIPSFKLHIPFMRKLRPKRNATVQNGSVKNRYTRFLHSVLQSACCHRFGRNRKTLSLRACVAISWKRNDKFFLRPCRNYSLLIIHYSLFFSKAEIARGDEKTGDKGE